MDIIFLIWVASSLNFELSVRETQKVRIELFDLNSKKIDTIANRTINAGNNSFIWSISNPIYDLKPGKYVVSITTGNSNIKKELKLIKR